MVESTCTEDDTACCANCSTFHHTNKLINKLCVSEMEMVGIWFFKHLSMHTLRYSDSVFAAF